jgi:hypothetical protein
VITFFAGFGGIIFFFADYGRGENEYTRLAIAFIYYFLFGLLLNWLIYPRTRASVLLIWGVTAVALLNFPQTLREGIKAFAETFLMVNVPLLAVLIAGRIILKLKSKKHHKK